MVNRKNMFKNRNKSKQKKKQPRPRKTYSIYGSKAQRDTPDTNERKRKLETKEPEQVVKAPKIEESTSSSDEEEVEDAMKQLRESFGGGFLKKAVSAIESSSDSEFDDNEAVEEEEEVKESEGDAAEAGVENEAEEDEDEGSDCGDEESVNDMFSEHLFYDLSENMLNNLQNTPVVVENVTKNWPCLGRLCIQLPKCEEEPQIDQNAINLSGDQKKAACGKPPTILKNRDQNAAIKVQIRNNVARKGDFTPLQGEIFSALNNYQDFFYPHRSFANAEELRFVYCVHVANHVLKTRARVLNHNARLKKRDGDVPEEFRDQGLVRPKVLIIVPFRDSAYRIIKMLIDILLEEDKNSVINKKRFIEDFTGNELIMPKKNPKPEDYEATFCGNSGDDFKIGITVTKKSLKLYTDFYSSDIIIASPLGLRFTIGAEGEPDRDYDLLASIELLILDQTEIFLMQNWDHLLHIFNHLHLQPKDSHGTDFSRVRTWSLDGHTKYYRQTVIFSSVILPEINAIFNKRCQNYSGKIKVVNEVTEGTIGQVFVQLPHVFQKFECASVAQSVDARFDFFVNKILPQHKETLMKQTLIYVANYFDYVRLRNYFKKEDINFVQICEYSKDGKVARARDMFFHGDAHFLLYTERYHFFHRIRVKGIRHLIFFQPPNFPHFYYEMCNLMQEANMNRKVGSSSNMTVTVLYSKYDVHQLSAIVTTDRAAKMIQSDRNVHMMLTGSE